VNYNGRIPSRALCVPFTMGWGCWIHYCAVLATSTPKLQRHSRMMVQQEYILQVALRKSQGGKRSAANRRCSIVVVGSRWLAGCRRAGRCWVAVEARGGDDDDDGVGDGDGDGGCGGDGDAARTER
jgi:hypothetical protein